VDFAVVVTVFAIIFLAELPDKTALASLVPGTPLPPWSCSGSPREAQPDRDQQPRAAPSRPCGSAG
jgi:hypothetical protein